MLFILDYQQNTIGVANNGSPLAMPYYSDVHTENLEGVNTYEFNVPSDHADAELIQTEGHVIITNLDGEQLLFTIKSVQDGNDSGKKVKQVYCEETAISELLSDVQRPDKLTSVTLESAVNTVLANTTEWELNDIPYSDSQDVEFSDYMTVLEALRQLATAYNVEIYFTVKLSGTKIVKKQINIVEERGNNTGVRFDYAYDLKGVTRTEDSSKVVTALIGVGKGDNNSVRVNMTSVASFEDGDFYHDVGSDWIGSESALQRWGRNGKHRFGVFIDDEADTPEELKRRTLKELEDRIIPDVNYSCSVTTLERLTGYDAKRLRLGDTIVVKDTSFKPAIAINARVVSIKRSYTRNDSDEIDLGNYKPITLTPNVMLRDLQNTISRSQGQWETIPADVQEQIQEIDNRTNDVQLIQTVVYSEDFTSILSDKANVTDISDMATGEQLTQAQADTVKYIDGRLDGEGGVIAGINEVSSQLEKTANSINAKFSSTGGINLLKNSIGYAGFDFWSMSSGASNGGITVIQNQELEQLGFGSGWASVDGTAGYIEQTISTNGGGKYSISMWLKKSANNLTDSYAYVDLFENGTRTARIGKGSADGDTTGWELGIYNFETQYNEVVIRVNFGSNAKAIVTGLMVNKGEDALQWQHATGEVYNTNVQMNLNGIKVINEATKGYTIMSPQEFSGYAEVIDDSNNRVMTRVFTLNGATTEVTELDVDNQVKMQSVKMIHINTGANKGWGFIADE